ncbi:MAG: hypothetical protein A2Z83_09620 [Omnitrophica bacterium GWA2_52_8]|nr:MAG: hypothetical protein A2Z83_09620 [Omnitrophica bacterium GWA2_52_8]
MKDWDTPFTPALGIVRALDVALDLIEKDGMEKRWKRAEELGDWTRKQLKGIGLELYSRAPSATVSAACVPAGVDGSRLVKVMRDEKGVTLAGGQGELTGKIVRIAHMGSITREDLECGIQILKETIQELSGKK